MADMYDMMHLEASDHPGTILVNTPLTGDNFFLWKRMMDLALIAKGKLGFVNCKLKININSSHYKDWKKVDCMVFSWILNSLSKDIVHSFVFAESSQELWDKICQRYGKPRGENLYRIHKEIANTRQGSDSVVIYFGKLKKLWDEKASLSPPVPVCADYVENNKLFEFLMGLNDYYDVVRNEILLMDPLPSVDKASTMVRTVDRRIKEEKS